ncbi:MAG: hypothetical protein R2684_09570 [Pyrinomonadaceae bacterium]
MSTKVIQTISVVLTTIGCVAVVWIYAVAPKNFVDLSIKARQSVASAVNKTRVVTNTYQIDQKNFQEGIAAFRGENYILARDRFLASDPEKRDAKVQYYIAYSLYRQGWGRISNDDELFEKALAQLETVKGIDPDYRAEDPDLKLKRPAELEDELKEGLRVTAGDFNPFKLVRERN